MNQPQDEVTKATAPGSGPVPGPAAAEVTRATVAPLPSEAPTILTNRNQRAAGNDATVASAGQAGALTRSGSTHLDVKGGAGGLGATPASAGSHHGEVWGDFELGALIGRGGMGAVYRGRQLSLDRPVAIKVLSEHLTGSADFRKRFLLEARAAARINSPQVVQVYFAGEHASNHYIAMEFVEGIDLAQKLKDGYRPDQRESLELAIQAARGLVALSEHKIVHRDIKPANYMVTTRGGLKLMDFGLVKFASESHGLTQTGVVMGTVSYFSPEQGRGAPCDQRTDIYALGVMFYELLTGKLPFTGSDATSVIYQHIHMAPRAIREINPSVPEPYQSVVMKCLEKDPAKRYLTAAELLADLESMQAGRTPLAAEQRAGSGRRRHPALWIAAAAVLAVVGAVLLLPRSRAATVPATAAPQPMVTIAANTPSPVPIAQPPVAPVVASPPTTVVPQAAPVAVAPVEPSPLAPAPKPASVEPAPAQPAPAPVIAADPVPAPIEPVKPIVKEPPQAAPEPPPTTKEPVVAVKEPPPAPVVAAPAPPPAAPAPAAPAGPAPIVAPVESSLRIQLPVQSGEEVRGVRWWLTGVPGRSGRLDARTTVGTDIFWSTPGTAGDAVLHASVIGSGRQVALPLSAVPTAAGVKRALTPFVHLGGDDDTPPARLARDADGSWWGLNPDKGIITHLVAGWTISVRFAPDPAPRKPLAIAARPDGLYVLDGDTKSVQHYQGGALKRTVCVCERPTDLVVAADGTFFVADQKGGGIRVFSPAGQQVALLAKPTPNGGSFDRLTHLSLGADGTLYALDAGARLVLRFDRQRQPLPPWTLGAGEAAVDLAAHPQGALVLTTSGELHLLADQNQGANARLVRSAASARLADDLAAAAGVTVDVDGEILVTYPERGFIARHDAQGAVDGLRSHRLWNLRALAADGQGRLLALDPSDRWLYLLDGDGFCVRRFGGPLKQGGSLSSPVAVAMTPDGQVAAALDTDSHQLVRFALDGPEQRPQACGGRGKGHGQLDEPVAVAMDGAGFSYVLDQGLHRVTVFDARGAFAYDFGRYERGDAPDILRAPRLLAVHPDGSAAFVYDDDAATVKVFTLDPANRRALYAGSIGTKGEGTGQIQRLSGLGCDRLGLLYLLDSKRNDLQVVDTRARPAVVAATFKAADLDIKRLGALGVSPDGQVYLLGDGMLTGLRW